MSNGTSSAKIKYSSVSLIVLLVLLVALYYFAILGPQQEYYQAHHVPINGAYLIHPLEINDFELTDTNGKKFTKKDLGGHWTLLFSGFTHCNSICPMVMDVLDKTWSELQASLPENALPVVVLMTVDPERDSLDKLHAFVKRFNSNFIGIRGNTRETRDFEDQLHIISNKINSDTSTPQNYNINHSGDILLINPQAKIQAYFRYPQHPDKLVVDYQAILKKYVELDEKNNR